MRESGVVTALDKNYCSVEISKKAECEKCGACLFPQGAGKVTLRAKNTLGAKAGDIVTIETDKNASFIAVVLVFLVPLVLIGVAVLLNYLLIGYEIWIPIISVILIAAWYTILAAFDKKLKNKKAFSPEVVAIEVNAQVEGGNPPADK